MKKIIIALLAVHCSLFTFYNFDSFAQKQANISIKGKITNNTDEKVYLDKHDNKTKTLDSAKIDDTGAFTIKTIINETGFYNLRLSDNKTLLLILSPGEKVELISDFTNFQVPVSISGSYHTILALGINKTLDSYITKQDSLNKVYEKYKNSAKKDSVINVLRKAFDTYAEQQTQLLRNFISKNLNSLSGLLFVNKLAIADNIELYKKYDSSLVKNYPKNNYVEEFHQQVIKNLRLFSGSEAPDIVAKDTSGHNVSLSSLKGKYVLIDFWASWCGPCRRESPNMVRLYDKYHEKGFEIFGVSLDKDKNSWKNAIKKDKLRWTHVSDLGFWNSAPAQLYNVTNIPYTVLLDKNGKIIAKGLYGAQIDEKLSTLLK